MDDEKAFLEYVRDEYFSFFEDNLKTGTERYEYSLFKIEQILEEIKNLISVQQICEMYWQRIVRTIKGRDIRNNRLANCIVAFNNNKCHLKPEWRKWLITNDEYSDLKNGFDSSFSAVVVSNATIKEGVLLGDPPSVLLINKIYVTP